MRLYKTTKAMIRFPDRDADFFGIVGGSDMLVSYMFIICLS